MAHSSELGFLQWQGVVLTSFELRYGTKSAVHVYTGRVNKATEVS
jgi:hypothetical protein